MALILSLALTDRSLESLQQAGVTILALPPPPEPIKLKICTKSRVPDPLPDGNTQIKPKAIRGSKASPEAKTKLCLGKTPGGR